VIDPRFITTSFDFRGYRIVQYCGVVRGIVVRSRSAIGTFAAGVQQFFGGHISLYTELCEQARQEAYDIMRQAAGEAGGNAIVGMRYASTDVAPGVSEVLCYGTSVVIELEVTPPLPQTPPDVQKVAEEAEQPADGNGEEPSIF
jgi:uncharacterized protein YbjQ (UPF0145 family)